MYLISFFNSLSSSDIIFYLLIILLTIISVILFFLIYIQNKEITKKMMEKSVFDNKESKKEEHIPVSVSDVEVLDNSDRLVQVSELEIPNTLELTKSLNIYEEENNSLAEENIVLDDEEIIDDTLVNDDVEDLQSLTRELEMLPREKTIKMTPYEERQEETAIISYDELVKQSESKYVEDVSLPRLSNAIVTDEVNYNDLVDVSSSYQHEESFLIGLKQLQSSMKERD